MRPDGTPASVRVELRRHLIVLDRLQQRREQLPRLLELVVADEQPLVSLHHVQDEALVRIRQAIL